MWNKYKKYILIAVFSIIVLIIIDISQAFIFQNSPVLKIREYFNGGTLYYKDKGLITYTYNCIGEKRKTVLKWEKYSCPLKETTFEIIDESKNIKDFTCAEALEEIYRDDEYIYFLSCMKSEHIKVNYSPDYFSENITTALKEGRVKISDLDIFKIDYIKKEISKEQLEKEEQVTDNKEENKKEEQSKKKESNKKDNKTNNNKNNSNENNNVNKNNNTNNKENNNESNGQNGGTTKPEENKPNHPKEPEPIPEPKPEPKTQAEINDEYRKKLENKYLVKIVYKDENGNYLIGGSINTEKLYDDNEINKYLKEVESALKKYPNGFFKEMKDNNVSLRIYMVNKIDGGHSGMTDGRNQSNITVTIGTAGTNLFEYTLHHELMHYIDIYMRQKDPTLNLAEIMKSYNPEGFRYGSNDSTYDYDFSNPNDAYFLSSYSRKSYLEDRAVLFSDMMARTTKRPYYNDGTPLNKKAKLINDQLHKYYNCVSKSAKEHWERFI
ncbi:MAG: hypothetical protein Q4C38_00300 [bacterium]|nr:hypothetical protein [bacterium]